MDIRRSREGSAKAFSTRAKLAAWLLVMSPCSSGAEHISATFKDAGLSVLAGMTTSAAYRHDLDIWPSRDAVRAYLQVMFTDRSEEVRTAISFACMPLDPDEASRIASVFRALADPVRLRLLSLITCCSDGEICVCDLSAHFDVTGPTISHHLKVLRTAGLIDSERRGTWVYYRANNELLGWLSRFISPDDSGWFPAFFGPGSSILADL